MWNIGCLEEKMIDIEKIVQMENEIEKFIEFYSKNSLLPVILYGAGEGVHWFIYLLEQYDIPIACIVDKKVGKGQVDSVDNVEIRNACDVFQDYEEAILVISAPKYRHEISEDIEKQMSLYHIFSFDPTLRALENISVKSIKGYYNRNRKQIENLWSCLEDEFSKKTLEHILRGRITSNCDFYQDIANESQYFPEIVKGQLGEKETFVDVGAYIGDSIDEFLKVVDNKFEKCYAFEPDDYNYGVLNAEFKEDNRVLVYKKGVGNENTVVYFKCKKSSDVSCVVSKKDNATSQIEIVRLDDIIKDGITFVKMDIEGMELDALRGAEEIIKKYRPILAISIYHKTEDIVEIPEYILSLDLGYKLYLRHYWECSGTDTILFAMI